MCMRETDRPPANASSPKRERISQCNISRIRALIDLVITHLSVAFTHRINFRIIVHYIF